MPLSFSFFSPHAPKGWEYHLSGHQYWLVGVRMSRYNIMPVSAEISMAAEAHIAEISEQVTETSRLLGEALPQSFVYVKLDERFSLGILHAKCRGFGGDLYIRETRLGRNILFSQGWCFQCAFRCATVEYGIKTRQERAERSLNQCRPLSPVSAMCFWHAAMIFACSATCCSLLSTTPLPAAKP